MTVFGASVPRRKRTAFVAPPGGREEEEGEPATKKGDGSSGADGSAVSTSSSSAPAADQGLPIHKNDAPLQPPVPKLMGDAIRTQLPVGTRAPAAVLAKAKKKRKRLGNVFWAGMRRDGQSTSSAGSSGTAVSLDKIDVVDDSLRRTLRELGVSPERIYGKRLWRSDRVMGQHRLLMSTKSWRARHGVPFPLDEMLTAEEKLFVQVQAYDRRGNGFVVDCKKLTSNNAYRLIRGWGKFLTNNGLVVPQDVDPKELELAMVELWAFRSPLLKVGVTNQPKGPLGLVIVHYRQGESPHADAAIAEILAAGSRAAMPMPRWVHRHVQAIPVHDDYAVPILEDAVHDHENDMPPVLELEDAVDAHVDTVPAVEFDEEMAMLQAAKAMLMLRYSFPTKTKRRRVR
ncbi:hypothetical protein ACQ4PT_047360 [Festuca glaucescens]